MYGMIWGMSTLKQTSLNHSASNVGGLKDTRLFQLLSHTHTLSLTHTHSLSHTLTVSHTHTISLSHTHTLSPSLSHTHTHSHTLSHTHTLSLSHTHTHSLSLTHTHTHTHTLFLSHTHTLSLSHTHTHTHSHTHTYTHSLSHTHTLSFSHTHTHTLSHTLSLSHTHTHTHTLTLSLSLSLSHTLSLFLSHTHTHSLSLSHTHTLTQSGQEREEESRQSSDSFPVPPSTGQTGRVHGKRAQHTDSASVSEPCDWRRSTQSGRNDATPLKQRDAISRAPLPAPAAEKAVPKLEPNFRKRPDPRWSGRPDDAIQARAFGRESKRSFPAILLLSASCSKPPAARNTELSMEPWTQTPALQGRCISRLYKDLRCFRSKCSIWCLHGCLCLMETLPPRIRAYRVGTNPPELYFIQSAL